MMQYKYTHTQTEATTGYFSCEPHPPVTLDAALAFLATHPLDDFMRRHLISRMNAMPAREVAEALARAFDGAPAPLAAQALAKELALLNPNLQELLEGFCTASENSAVPDSQDCKSGTAHLSSSSGNDIATEGTSLILLRWKRLADRALHSAWGRIFADNIQHHRALQAPGSIGLEPLYGDSQQAIPGIPGLSPCFTAPVTVTLDALHAQHLPLDTTASTPYTRPPSAETAAIAEERLAAQSIIAGQEMRHVASLSPIALLRPWNISLTVQQGRHKHTLQGEAKTYGRGLSVADARASCLMEMVERASMYLSVTDTQVENRLHPTPVVSGTRSELLHAEKQSGIAVLDPNDFPLEAPYTDTALVWMQGHTAQGKPVHIPVQMASLFCNLDEVSLFDSPGSTGIATGCTLEEAKVAALTEIFERDAEATTPFTKASCFTLEADAATDPLIARLLADYKARGIHVQFQDLTGPMGLPVYKCFVMSMKGAIARGHGAGLNARRAIISALTETPFPYPDGGPSGPVLRKLPVRKLHELPDYSLSTPARNLALLEELLTANNRPPVYAELTRKDLLFPVVRALVPGMELAADSDTFTRVPLRLYKNYLRMFD